MVLEFAITYWDDSFKRNDNQQLPPRPSLLQFASSDPNADKWTYWMQQPLSSVKQELMRHRISPPSWIIEKSQLVEKLMKCLQSSPANGTEIRNNGSVDIKEKVGLQIVYQ